MPATTTSITWASTRSSRATRPGCRWVALGAARYEEVYPLGYPHPGLGGRTFVHRWGPFASALRSLGVGRFGRVWVETDLHYAPYRPRQLVLFLDIGVGVHL